MTVVLDASVTLAWVHGDERTDAIIGLFETIADGAAHVPSLWPLEVANSLMMAVRRGRTNEELVERALVDLKSIRIEIDADTADHAWGSTMRLAEAYRLTVYDAAYLELAQRRRLPLATLDKALAAASQQAGVELAL